MLVNPESFIKRSYAFIISDEFVHFLRHGWSVSWPMLVIMFFEFAVNLTDVYIAGLLGEEYQATVGFVAQFYFMFIILANAVTVGTVSLISRLYTAGDVKALAQAVWSIIIAVAVAGLFLSLGGITLSSFIFSYLDIPDVVRDKAVPLVEIYALGLLFHYFLINSNGILRSSGRIKFSMSTMATVALMNIPLNFILVFMTPLGYRGIALSTVLSFFAGALLNLRKVLLMVSEAVAFSLDVIKKVISIGWPFGMVQVAWQTGSTVLFLILGSLPQHNVEIMAAFTNGLRMESFLFMPAFAFSFANAVLVGNFLGEGKKTEALKAGVVNAMSGVMVIIVLSLILFLSVNRIAPLLSDNQIVITESIKYIHIILLAQPLMVWAVNMGGALNGAGKTMPLLVTVIVAIWCIRLPLAYFIGIVAGLGHIAIWWSMNVSMIVHTIIITTVYFRRKWLNS